MSNNFISGEPWASGQVVTATKLLKAVQEALVDPSYAGELAELLQPFTTPAGKLDYFASGSVPTGWLECDGAAVSRSTYAALFTAIGTTYGAGDGSTTFAIPDYRGYFLRAFGTNANGLFSGPMGAKQADEFKSHSHNLKLRSAGQGSGPQAADSPPGSITTTQTELEGGAETRPHNMAALLCIKF